MIGRGDDSGHAVHTGGETVSDVGSQDTVLSDTVDTLEEIELGGVEGSGLVKRSHLLDDDVLVTDDVLRGGVDLLRSGVVGLLGVGEVASDEVVLLELDGEALALFDFTAVLGERELAGGHVALETDLTHRGGVTETGGDLLASSQRELRRLAEVDEVVRGCERGDLAGCGSVFRHMMSIARIVSTYAETHVA